MKMLAIIIILAFVTVFPQQDKGKISLNFNGELIELPINTLTLRKEDKILISVRAEQNDSVSQKMIGLELGFKTLSVDDRKEPDLYETRLQISTRDIKESSGKELLLSLHGEPEGHYGIYSKGERVSWDISVLQVKFSMTKISYENDKLIIVGKFSGTFHSMLDRTVRKDIAEIKDGKFEIII